MSEPPKPVLKIPPGFQNPVPKKLPGSKQVHYRKPILPVSNRSPKKKQRTCCRTCCCATCLVLLILMLLVAVTGCLMYLVLEPKVPVFHLQSVRFVRFNVTDGTDGSVLDSEAVVIIQVKSRNSVLRLNYGKTHVGLGSGDVDFGTGSFPAFSQAKSNTTVLKLTTKVKGVLLDSGTGKKMRDVYRSKRLKMKTEVNTEVGVGAKGWNTIKFPIKAICEGVSLKDLESGSSVPKCKITLFKIFKIKT